MPAPSQYWNETEEESVVYPGEAEISACSAKNTSCMVKITRYLFHSFPVFILPPILFSW